jgi:hypothetical protein
MKFHLLIIFSLLLFNSCQDKYEIQSISIGEQKHITGEHYDSELTVCLDKGIGIAKASFSFFVLTNDGNNFELKYDVSAGTANYVFNPSFNPSFKCFSVSTRSLINKKGATKIDLQRMKYMAKGNIKRIRVVIWNKQFTKPIADKTFFNL